MKKKVSNNKKNILSIIMIIFIGTLSLSLINIIGWFNDNRNIEKEMKKINEIVEVNEIISTENEEEEEKEEEKEVVNKFNPYIDYVYMNLIDVNIKNLKEINSDVVGWIKVNGTTVNYPFVQTNDNEYYLTHSFYKNDNKAGWVFLDYRNNMDEINRNNILYAHARLNNTMFGSLRNILKSKWVNNPNNYYVKISTIKENTLWQVFSIYTIPTTNDYLRINFKDDDSFMLFLNMLKDRSEYNFNTELNSEDKILTLSTCYDENNKTVLHAKLIKREAK